MSDKVMMTVGGRREKPRSIEQQTSLASDAIIQKFFDVEKDYTEQEFLCFLVFQVGVANAINNKLSKIIKRHPIYIEANPDEDPET
jgi:hypothetical protein